MRSKSFKIVAVATSVAAVLAIGVCVLLVVSFELHQPDAIPHGLGPAMQGAYLGLEREGEWLLSYPDGKKQLITYHQGREYGLTKMWYPHGGLLELGKYEDGRRVGPWVYWRKDGRVDHDLTGLYRGWTRIGALSEADIQAALAEVR